MAHGDMAVAAILLSLTVMVCVEEVRVAAQAPSPSTTAPASGPPITCNLPNSSMVSSNYCNSYDQQSMATQTAGCNGFLTDQEPAPSAACCKGLNEVAYNRTACICSYTFYPPSTNNASRQLELPRLCGVLTNLCGQCPTFLVTRSNGSTSAAPICKYS